VARLSAFARLVVASLLLASAAAVLVAKVELEATGPYLEALPLHPFCDEAAAALAAERVGEAIEVAEAGGCDAVAEEARERWTDLTAVAERCWDGVWTGRGEDGTGAACAVVSDLVVFGDVRDLTRQGVAWARGDETDPVLIALSTAGLVLTVAPAAGAGTSLLKVGRRAGTLGRGLADDVVRLVRQGAWGAVGASLADAGRLSARLGPAGGVRALAYADDASELALLARYVETARHPLLAMRSGCLWTPFASAITRG
jgi:hypothetical protein